MPKRIVAFSDSHGDRKQLERAICQAYEAGRVDELLFLGDGVRDWEQVTSYLPYQYPQASTRHVLGNNDMGCQGAGCGAPFAPGTPDHGEHAPQYQVLCG